MKAPYFDIKSYWWRGPESAEVVAGRLTRTLTGFEPLSPIAANWQLLNDEELVDVPLSDIQDMTAFVEINVVREESGEIAPGDGYLICASGSEMPEGGPPSEEVQLSAWAGSNFSNSLDLSIGSFFVSPPERLITYAAFRGWLEVLAKEWPCPWVFAAGHNHRHKDDQHPDPIPPLQGDEFRNVWIGYLSPAYASGVVPSSDLKFEPTPGGGLIISAVEERFDPVNRDHLRRSRILQFLMCEQVGPNSTGAELARPPRKGPY